MRSSRQQRPAEADWQRHKESIRQMIVEQNLSQEETRSRLKSVGFVVSKSQLEYKLRVWGFRKKAPKNKSRALWQHVGYRIDKRGLQGKSSQVWLNGILVDSAKVRKEVNRHQPNTLSKIARENASPKTPKFPEICINTPSPALSSAQCPERSPESPEPFIETSPISSIPQVRPQLPKLGSVPMVRSHALYFGGTFWDMRLGRTASSNSQPSHIKPSPYPVWSQTVCETMEEAASRPNPERESSEKESSTKYFYQQARTLQELILYHESLQTSVFNKLFDQSGGNIQRATNQGNQNVTKRTTEIDKPDTDQRNACLSILERCIINGNKQMVAEFFSVFPSAYSPGALCACVFWADAEPNTAILKQLLRNRQKSENTHPMECLAIGIAAFLDRIDLLDVLLETLPHPHLAALPHTTFSDLASQATKDAGRALWPLPSSENLLNEPMYYYRIRKQPFWQYEHMVHGSPLSLALFSRKSLSRLLEHGLYPDRLTMSIAAGLGERGPIRELALYPMLESGFENFSGPLSVSVMRNNVDIAKSLLDIPGCVNENNTLVERGRSPLQRAIECGNPELTNILLEAGADVNAPPARRFGVTALQIAAIIGHLEVVKSLIELGADMNAPGAIRAGRTALEGAAEKGRIDVVRHLLSQGVQTREEGRLPYLRSIRYADIEGHQSIVNLLKSWRSWTVEDDTRWEKLRSLSSTGCEEYQEDTGGKVDPQWRKENDDHGDEGQSIVFEGLPTVYMDGLTWDLVGIWGGIFFESDGVEVASSSSFDFDMSFDI